MKKKIILGIVILVLLGLAYGGYEYFRPHQSLKNLKSDVTLTAENLFTEYETDETTSNEKYLDKVIEVTGKIKLIATKEDGITTITLDANNDLSGVICELDKSAKHRDFKTGEAATFKGMCTGMLMDVVLVRCVEK